MEAASGGNKVASVVRSCQAVDEIPSKCTPTEANGGYHLLVQY